MMPVSTDDMDYDGESGAGYNRGAESKGSQSYHFTQQQLSSQQVIMVNFQDVCQWVESKFFTDRTIKLYGLFTLAVIRDLNGDRDKDKIRLRFHVPSTSKRSKVSMTKTVTLTVCVKEPSCTLLCRTFHRT